MILIGKTALLLTALALSMAAGSFLQEGRKAEAKFGLIASIFFGTIATFL